MYLLWRKVYSEFLLIFLIGVFVILLLSYMSSLYILDINLSIEIWSANIFPCYRLSFYSVDIVFVCVFGVFCVELFRVTYSHLFTFDSVASAVVVTSKKSSSGSCQGLSWFQVSHLSCTPFRVSFGEWGEMWVHSRSFTCKYPIISALSVEDIVFSPL